MRMDEEVKNYKLSPYHLFTPKYRAWVELRLEG